MWIVTVNASTASPIVMFSFYTNQYKWYKSKYLHVADVLNVQYEGNVIFGQVIFEYFKQNLVKDSYITTWTGKKLGFVPLVDKENTTIKKVTKLEKELWFE